MFLNFQDPYILRTPLRRVRRMVGLKELKPEENIPQITISKDRTSIYLLSTTRRTLGDPEYVRIFFDTVGDTVVIAIQPAPNGHKVQKGGHIKIGKELKKLKIKKGQRSNDYLLIEVPGIGKLHAFFFGEVPEEYKKYAVNREEEPVEDEAPVLEEHPEPTPTTEVETPEPVTDIGEDEEPYIEI
jgi:hypothetical protein